MQVSLLVDGSIEMKYADRLAMDSDGRRRRDLARHTEDFLPIDLTTVATGTIAEMLGNRRKNSERLDVDLVELTRKFFRIHPDNFDQLIILRDTRHEPRTLVCVRGSCRQ